MPLSFAFIANAIQRSNQVQNEVLEIFKMTANLGTKDVTRGKLAAMAAGSLAPPRPQGKPSISDPTLAYIVNVYYTFDLPEAQKTPGKEGRVIEVLLEQKFYAVMSMLNARPGVSAGACWPPFAVKSIGTPKDLNKIILDSAPPRPIVPLADLNVPANARLSTSLASLPGDSPYANAPGDSGYANGGAANPYGTIIPYVPDPGSDLAVLAPPGGNGSYGLPIYRPQPN